MNKDTEINQTQFASQEPVMEGLVNYDDPIMQEEQPKQKKKGNKLVLVGIIGFILIVVFILLLILIRVLSAPKTVQRDSNGQVINQVDREIDPLLEEVYLLSEELEDADPSIDKIPFPPVDMELRLDPPVK